MTHSAGSLLIDSWNSELHWKHLVRDAGCQRGACRNCLRKTGVDGRSWPSHCRGSFVASQEVFYLGRPSDRPALRTQVRGAGETDWWTSTRSVRPSSRVSVGAQKHRRGCW